MNTPAASPGRDDGASPLERIVDSFADVWWIVATPPLRFAYVSPACERQGRGTAARLHADPAAWFDAIHADDRERLRERLARIAETDGYEDEYRVVDADGVERWVSERVVPLREAAGHEADAPRRWAGVTQDHTLRKRAELLLVGADRRKDEFLALLSHELRNPLAPIRSAVDVLASPRTDADARASALRIVRRQVDHLARLVDDLLDVARINQGKIALDRRPLQLQAVVATAIETAQPLLQSKGHTLIANLPDADVWVDGDRVRLTQAFGNLLNNAVKFTPPEGALRVDVTSAPGRVAVSVADTGCGIAPEVLPHVFDLFAQASQAVDRSHGGLGVGLALVRRIVAMHGGDVVAASDGAGRGSRFTVTLPRCAAPAATASPAAAPAASSRHGALRILAVDDNEDALETLAMLLETQGHAVHMATHGERALALAREVEPHVVLLDIGLPGMNGYELAGALRTLGLETPPMLVAISGYGREDDRRRAREAGFAHHLVKPADPERLFDIIDGAATELLQNNR